MQVVEAEAESIQRLNIEVLKHVKAVHLQNTTDFEAAFDDGDGAL